MNNWQTRQTLLSKIRDQHDELAWEDFVAYYRQYIQLIVLRMNLSHHEAEEITQQVLIKLWQKLPGFQYNSERGRFRGWLCRVTGNTVRTHLHKHRREISQADPDAFGEIQGVENFSEPEIEAIAEQEWKTYVASLAWSRIEAGLAPRARQCFLLVSQGLETAQIAGDLGISDSSVYVYKKRVQDRLIQEIRLLEQELL